MTTAKARIASLSRFRKPASLRAVAAALLLGNERDIRRAKEFAAKADRIERQQTKDFAAALR